MDVCDPSIEGAIARFQRAPIGQPSNREFVLPNTMRQIHAFSVVALLICKLIGQVLKRIVDERVCLARLPPGLEATSRKRYFLFASISQLLRTTVMPQAFPKSNSTVPASSKRNGAKDASVSATTEKLKKGKARKKRPALVEVTYVQPW
ncbi:hypothetical protein AWB79_04430 [Caballeronia hypogeia]|uniref:Uncharacterized protein n=1 Tax=Caballeronia hypogeia TaxID=1777140 RepID=A0A158BY22_9BURK|nr:hypothetical protein [Caballeronia hypogeia]SAK74992.1 hypothetical protein AWB79_04430 [Caballeronia hypogeia]